MKIVITGSKGQLGSELIRQLACMKSYAGDISQIYENAEVIGVDVDTLDLTDETAICEFMQSQKPDLVFHNGAMTNVDGCEDMQDIAFAVNGTAPTIIARECEKIGAKLVAVSTDYVFDGKGTRPYLESDSTCPVSVYGKSKLAGEDGMRKFCSKLMIVRTAWLYGNGKNFVKTIIANGKKRGELKVVSDQLGNPTNTEDLAYHMLKLGSSELYGTYHITGNGICSWYDFACEIIRLAGVTCTVNKCATGEFAVKAPRPAYSALSHKKLEQAVGDEMRDWKQALESYIAQLDISSL